MSVRVLNSEKRELGEGPHWLASKNQLLIVDIRGKAIKWIDFTSGNIVESHTFDDRVGAAIPDASEPNSLVVAVGNRLVRYNTESRQVVETLCDVSEHEKGVRTRINDAKCDPYGRIVFGTMPRDPSDEYPANKGKLYSYAKGELRVLLEEVGLSNGLAWSRDNRTMFYVDSLPDMKVLAFDYDEQGRLANQRVLLDFKEGALSGKGIPDGMTIDVQDNIWLAMYRGSHVLNIDPRTGKVLSQVKIPSLNVTSVCFGGPDLSTLLVTSASTDTVPENLHEELGGCTFAITGLGTKGRQAVEFAG